MRLLLAWAVNALCLLLVAWLLPAVTISSPGAALMVALVLGLLNTLVRPVLVLMTLPINLATLGVFLFVINGFLIWLTTHFVEGFAVASLSWAIVAAMIYSPLSWLVGLLILPRKH